MNAFVLALLMLTLRAKVYGYPTAPAPLVWVEPRSIIPCVDKGGGYLVVGRYVYDPNNPSSDQGDIFMLRLDTLLNIVWFRTVGMYPSREAGLQAVQLTEADSGYFVCAASWSGGTPYLICLRINPEGDVLWSYEHPSFYINGDKSTLVSRDPGTSNVVITGARNIGFQWYAALMCLDMLTGNTVWEYNYYAPNVHLLGTNIARTPQSGEIFVSGTYSDNVYQNSVFLACFTRTGDPSWAIACTTTLFLDPTSIRALNDSTFYVLVNRGPAPSAAEIWKFRNSSPLWYQGFLDFSGNEIYLFSNGNLIICGNGPDLMRHAWIALGPLGGFTWSGYYTDLYPVNTEYAMCESPQGILTSVGASNSPRGIGALDCSVIQIPANTGQYPGCVAPAGFSTSGPEYGWVSLNLTALSSSYPSTSLTLSSVQVPLLVDSLCSSLYEETQESEKRPIQSVLPLFSSEGIIFLSSEDADLVIYHPTGALAYRGRLRCGRQMVPLGPGVYLWRAGDYKGKAVVR